MLSVSSRLQAVQSPVIPVVGALVRDHPGTISLGQGVVSYGPPDACWEAVRDFSKDVEHHKYTAVEGIPELRQRIIEKLARENGVRVGDGNAVVVTAGANMAFLNALLAIADPGDEIVLLTPYYFNNEMAVTMVGCKPVLVATDHRFQLRVDEIEAAITPRTRAVVTISPNNPTGAVYPRSDLEAVNELCKSAGIYHIHDEAYEYFTYGAAQHFSPASIAGSEAHTVSLYSLSKAYGFASWRIGYQVIPESLLEAVKKIQDTNVICPPVISQFAAVAALNVGRGYCEARLSQLGEIRQTVLEGLGAIDDLCEVAPAQGAFYFFVKLRTDADPMTLVERLVKDHGVAAIPGSAFGYTEQCAIRISYGALTPEVAERGIGRLARGIRALLEEKIGVRPRF